MKKIDLSTTVNGIRFENPFILSSAPPTASNRSIRRAFDAGWAGVVIKTVKSGGVDNSNVTPRFATLKSQNKVIGLENIELSNEKPVDYWVDTIIALKKDYPTKVVIASIMGSHKESWQSLATAMCTAGADALELNFSCPNGVNQQGFGLLIGQDDELIKTITSWVKAVATVPVLVKLTPNVTNIASCATAAVAGGADAIAAINTVSCLIGVDIDTLSPLPSVDGASTYGGYSGIAIKPIGLRCVAQIANAVQVPVYGMGGISTWKDALEYIALGAGAVQVCTEVMLNGYSVVTAMIAGLGEYMKNKGIESIDEIRGVALKKVVAHSDLNRDFKVVAYIDQEKCVICSKCEKICKESGYHAIFKKDARFVVDTTKCDGCSLCTCACKKGAIFMEKKW